MYRNGGVSSKKGWVVSQGGPSSALWVVLVVLVPRGLVAVGAVAVLGGDGGEGR